MNAAKIAFLTSLWWSGLSMLCIAQPFPVIGHQPGVGLICASPYGPSPCAFSQQNSNNGRIIGLPIPAQTQTVVEIGLRRMISVSLEKRVKGLGNVNRVIFSASVQSQGINILNAIALHENGVSEWRIGIHAGGEIAISELIDIRSDPDSVSEIIRGPSAVLGRLDNFPAPSNRIGDAVGRVGGNSSTGSNAWIDSSDVRASQGGSQQSVSPAAPNGYYAQPLPPIVDSRVVEFLFATTRNLLPVNASKSVSFGGERAALSFGVASVRIPDDHKIGQIELPGSWRLFGLTIGSPSNDRSHFIIKRTAPISEEKFANIVKASNSKTALIFVHGFNTSFEESIYRNAQVVWDLQYRGISVLFSWASRGEVTDYVYDKESAYLARDGFLDLIKKLKNDYGIEQINVLSHSMGNLITLEALAGYSQTKDPVSIARFFMAAPDVDRDLFINLVPKAKRIVGGITLYASSADKALAVSRRLAGGVPRAGDVPPVGPVIVPGIVDTIDVTAVGSDVLGLNHNVFASSRNVMEDIAALLRTDKPPPRLIQIRAVPEPPDQVRYWRYVH